jgi:hypothetical protein
MVRRFVQFGVLCIAKYRYGETIFHRNGKFFPVREIRHQFSSNSSHTGKIAGTGQRYLFLSGLPTWGIFPPK